MYKILIPINEEKITIPTLKNGKTRKKRSVITTSYTEKSPFTSYEEACHWIHSNTSFSVHEATRQGYKISKIS